MLNDFVYLISLFFISLFIFIFLIFSIFFFKFYLTSELRLNSIWYSSFIISIMFFIFLNLKLINLMNVRSSFLEDEKETECILAPVQEGIEQENFLLKKELNEEILNLKKLKEFSDSVSEDSFKESVIPSTNFPELIEESLSEDVEASSDEKIPFYGSLDQFMDPSDFGRTPFKNFVKSYEELGVISHELTPELIENDFNLHAPEELKLYVKARAEEELAKLQEKHFNEAGQFDPDLVELTPEYVDLTFYALYPFMEEPIIYTNVPIPAHRFFPGDYELTPERVEQEWENAPEEFKRDLKIMEEIPDYIAAVNTVASDNPGLIDDYEAFFNNEIFDLENLFEELKDTDEEGFIKIIEKLMSPFFNPEGKEFEGYKSQKFEGLNEEIEEILKESEEIEILESFCQPVIANIEKIFYYEFGLFVDINIYIAQLVSVFFFLLFLLLSFFIYKNIFINFEFYFLSFTYLFALLILLMSNSFLNFYVSLELFGLISYVFVSYFKTSFLSIEASIKYFFFSSFASILVLLGITFIYLATGVSSFHDLSIFISQHHFSLENDFVFNYKIFYFGLFFIFLGFFC